MIFNDTHYIIGHIDLSRLRIARLKTNLSLPDPYDLPIVCVTLNTG